MADKYILFTGSMQPKNPMLATESKIKEITGAGLRQGKDFDIVSLKILQDKLGKKSGGIMNINEIIKPLSYGGMVKKKKTKKTKKKK